MGNFQGVLRHFQGGLKNFLGGRGLTFFQEGLRIFHKGLGFFGKGLRFSSSVWYCFSYVDRAVMLVLERGIFSVRLRFFREARGLNFFGGVEMLSEVFGIFSGGIGIIFVVLSLFRGFERFLGRGRYFQGD